MFGYLFLISLRMVSYSSNSVNWRNFNSVSSTGCRFLGGRVLYFAIGFGGIKFLGVEFSDTFFARGFRFRRGVCTFDRNGFWLLVLATGLGYILREVFWDCGFSSSVSFELDDDVDLNL